MERQLAVVTAEHAYLRSGAGETDGSNQTGIEDEIFSGWAVEILEEDPEKAFVKVLTHYGYEGYVRKTELRPMTKEELKERQEKSRFYRIGISEADLLDRPKVQGLPLELLLKNAIVEYLEDAPEGWCRVRSAAGREGYIHQENLRERREDDGFLLTEDRVDYFAKRREALAVSEEAFREGIVASAREFLGTQYRWGGKSSQGIDCSGLAFMSYLDNGLLIYRDASIEAGYPVKKIPVDALKKGDLIFFPGRVAIYLGEDRYIHSTGYAKTPCVTINSFRKEDPDFRADLVDKITEGGSVFA